MAIKQCAFATVIASAVATYAGPVASAEPGNPGLPDMDCSNPASLISDIQGTGDVSPLAGENLVVEAVVTAAFNGDGGLCGFYIEAAADQRDSNPSTSEGLFVYAPGESVAVGQRLRIAGEVTEFGNLTELTNVTNLADCGTATLPAPDSYRASDHDPVIIALNMGAASPIDRADLNGDGRINGRDIAQLVLARLFGNASVEHYDINRDGHVNRGDLFAIQEAKRGR
jgi:predicted extracellular nuclease